MQGRTTQLQKINASSFEEYLNDDNAASLFDGILTSKYFLPWKFPDSNYFDSLISRCENLLHEENTISHADLKRWLEEVIAQCRFDLFNPRSPYSLRSNIVERLIDNDPTKYRVLETVFHNTYRSDRFNEIALLISYVRFIATLAAKRKGYDLVKSPFIEACNSLLYDFEEQLKAKEGIAEPQWSHSAPVRIKDVTIFTSNTPSDTTGKGKARVLEAVSAGESGPTEEEQIPPGEIETAEKPGPTEEQQGPTEEINSVGEKQSTPEQALLNYLNDQNTAESIKEKGLAVCKEIKKSHFPVRERDALFTDTLNVLKSPQQNISEYKKLLIASVKDQLQ